MTKSSAIRLVAVLAALAVGCSKKESGEKKAPDQPAPAPSPDTTTPPGEPDLPAGAVKEKAIDACTLVTKAEIEAVTKRKVSDPVPVPTGNMSMCTFGDPEGNAPLGLVKLTAVHAGGPGPAKSIYEVVTTDPKEKREPVQGVGEAASLNNDEYASHLFVLKGVYTLEVNVNLADKSLKRDANAEKAAAIEIATKAVAKLP